MASGLRGMTLSGSGCISCRSSVFIFAIASDSASAFGSIVLRDSTPRSKVMNSNAQYIHVKKDDSRDH